MADERKNRLARNESAFRSLNESIESDVHRGREEVKLGGFLCECGDADCEALVRMRLAEYESIRRDPMLFLLVPGHEALDTEDVVDSRDGYLVVRKHEDVADIATQTDPRHGRS